MRAYLSYKYGEDTTVVRNQGRAFEDLACYLCQAIPGVSIAVRNQMNVFNNEEIDLAVWNDKLGRGLHFSPNIILIECKN